MRKVLVNKDGLAINAIEIEDGANWTPPDGCKLLDKSSSDKMNIGDTLIGNNIVKALIPTEDTSETDELEKIISKISDKNVQVIIRKIQDRGILPKASKE